MKKISLLALLAACALTTACTGHDKCYEDARYGRSEATECGCHKSPCGCHKKACGCGCGCGAAPVAMTPQIMPMMQPKTIVVVVPAAQKPQRRVFTPEIVYPEPTPCGCKRK